MEQSDEQLMLEYKAGRKDAVQIIFLRYKYRILNFCWRMLGNRGEAEDVSGEVFMSLFTSQYEPQSGVKFSTWLYTIARNHCVDVIRKRSRSVREDVSESVLSHFATESASGPRDDLSLKESGDHVREAIQHLPTEQMEAIILQHYENLSYDEISKALGCSIDKVKILIFRAKENLRIQLAFILKEGKP
ncbi:MAG: RNA polymerase sigma factor [Candidatus Omnitrophica bacterium]|nr:RNA polymerase sigma factor [Candidatus Omnitrophota bacterium]